jgi:hypothetical protein
MVDESNNNQSGVSFQGAQQVPGQEPKADPKVSTPAQAQEPGKESQEQSFVTQADFEKKIDSLANRFSAEIQSFADRSESRLSQQIVGANTELDKKFAELASAGTPVPENIQSEERDRVLREALRNEVTQPPQQDATVDIAGLQLDPKFLDNREYVNYQAFLLASQTGFIIEQDDPEVKELSTRGTGQDYLQSYAKALQDKSVRTGKGSPPSGDAKNVPSTGGGGAEESWRNENDPSKLLTIGLAEMD